MSEKQVGKKKQTKKKNKKNIKKEYFFPTSKISIHLKGALLVNKHS